MQDDLRGDRIDFALSESALKYLSKTLPDWTKYTSQHGVVPILSFSGGGSAEKDGKVTWQYRGPLFLLASQKHEALPDGKYYDLLGFPVWIQEFDYMLLRGRVLTFTEVGGPQPEKHLVIENAGEDFLETVFRQAKDSALCRPPHADDRV